MKLYICDITITARTKTTKKTIVRENYPLVLNEDMIIPPEVLNSKLRRAVKDHIEFKKFGNYSYSYSLENIRFSSEIYKLENKFA